MTQYVGPRINFEDLESVFQTFAILFAELLTEYKKIKGQHSSIPSYLW